MNYQNIITIEPGKRGGRPCIRNMRIAVADVLGWLAAGMSHEQIISDYPELTEEDIRASLAYAADPKQIVDEVWNGIPPVATGPFVQGSPYYAPTGYPTYNPTKAAQLVKEIQSETGKPIPTFTFNTITSQQYARINVLVQASQFYKFAATVLLAVNLVWVWFTVSEYREGDG